MEWATNAGLAAAGRRRETGTKNMRRALVNGFMLGLTFLHSGLAGAHVFPYVPTQFLAPHTCFDQAACLGKDLVYIFAQTDDGSVQFSALNFSASVQADAQLITVTRELPFLKDAPGTTAFGAARTSSGSVVVYAGACDGDVGSLWTYTGDDAAAAPSGTWARVSTTAGGADHESIQGPAFLGGTLAFSSKLAPTMDLPRVYTYGGMCTTTDAGSSDWQSRANYTKDMKILAPRILGSDVTYSLSVAPSNSPRSPVAGFTLTMLPPSITNISGSISQQAGSVLLGGHTRQAFINMSTAAVWNLPEQSWSYLNIAGPDPTDGGLSERHDELSGRSIREIESRSGHTAVLTEDGSSIVVMGGWVGSPSNAAKPQLAILQLSPTYDSWKWSIPRAQPQGNSMFGHGAAILPGNVMVVYGGWDIPAGGGGSASKRQASTSASLMRFFNLTSMSWSNSYENPKAGSRNPDAAASNDSSQSKRLGLGLGLGLGMAVLLVVLILFLLWRGRLRKRRQSREKEAQAVAQDAHYFAHDRDEMVDHDDLFAWNGPSYNVYPDTRSGRAPVYESLRGSRGFIDEGDIRYMIPRKPVMSRAMRGGYAPAEIRTNAFISPPGRIHPILEDDEEDSHRPAHRTTEPTTPTSEITTDPFVTPTAVTVPPVIFPPVNRFSSSPSPEGHNRHDPDVQDWVCDVDAADSLLDRYNHSRQGRVSPTRKNSTRSAALRDDESRSGSNLSESNRSAGDSIRRSRSNRRSATAGSFFGSMFVGGVDHPKSSSCSSSSYNTARSGFAALQAEGPALLGRATPTNVVNEDEQETEAPSSPSKHKPRRGWLGSLRRVFKDPDDAMPAPATESTFPEGGTNLHSNDFEPRPGVRGELLRRKQGRQDWEDDATQQDTRESQPALAENEWDIEKAVEQRLVQVMFTVPKERLRVVNGDERSEDEHIPEQKFEPENETVSRQAHLTEGHIRELHEPHVAELIDPSSSPPPPSPPRTPSPGAQQQEQREKRGRLSGSSQVEDPDYLHVDMGDRRLSHCTDDSGRRSSGAVFLAQAISFERPRTRVLQMVDTIESRSQSNSPTGRRSEA